MHRPCQRGEAFRRERRHGTGSTRGSTPSPVPPTPHGMSIDWKHDFDAALERAGELDRPILLDFSAAPM